MGSTFQQIAAAPAYLAGGFATGKSYGEFKDDVFGGLDFKEDMPAAPALPPPVEEIDAESAKDYQKKLAKQRQGRASTILTSMGSSNQGKKTVLG